MGHKRVRGTKKTGENGKGKNPWGSVGAPKILPISKDDVSRENKGVGHNCENILDTSTASTL